MKSTRLRIAVSILAFTIAALVAVAHAQSESPQTVVKFQFGRLVLDGGESEHGWGINNKSRIVGDYTDSAGQQHPMYFKGQPAVGPSCPGYRDTVFLAVNSASTAVAYCYNPGGAGVVGANPQGGPCDGVIPCAMLYDGIHYKVDPNPPCLSCPYMALAINDPVVGPELGGLFQDPTQGLTHGYVSNLQTGEIQVLDVPGTNQQFGVQGINNAGQATLQASDAAGLMHSYLYSGGSYTNIDVPGAMQSFAHGINNNGDIVYSVEDYNRNSWGVLFYAKLRQFYWFNQPDGRRDQTWANGINDEVQTRTGSKLKIVGEYSIPGSAQTIAYRATVTIKP